MYQKRVTQAERTTAIAMSRGKRFCKLEKVFQSKNVTYYQERKKQQKIQTTHNVTVT